jgi:hypothetical protein
MSDCGTRVGVCIDSSLCVMLPMAKAGLDACMQPAQVGVA